MYETHIVLLKIDSNKGRTDLERIENSKFDSIADAVNVLCFDEDAPVAVEDVNIVTLSDFVDACNSTDDDTPEDEIIDIQKNWIGYVQIHK